MEEDEYICERSAVGDEAISNLGSYEELDHTERIFPGAGVLDVEVGGGRGEFSSSFWWVTWLGWTTGLRCQRHAPTM